MLEPTFTTVRVNNGAKEQERSCPACLSENIFQKNSFLYQCICGFVFDNPRPTPQAIADYYNQNDKYDHWLVDLAGREEMWNRRIRKMARFHKPGSLLDIGSGIGQFLSIAREEGYKPVYGTEVSSIGAEIASQRFQINLFCGDIETLEMPIVDNLTAFHVLEHVHRPLDFLRRCRELLAPGGVMTIAVPNDIDDLMHRVGRHQLGPIHFGGEEIHLSHFTTKTLRAIVERAGFHVINVSLDPFWPRRDWKQTARFKALSVLEGISGINLYPTIWLTAT